MATTTITFEDSEDGVLVALNFDTELPEDPAQASDAQIQAMMVFHTLIGDDPDEVQSPNGEPDFDPAEEEFVDLSEEQGGEV